MPFSNCRQSLRLLLNPHGSLSAFWECKDGEKMALDNGLLEKFWKNLQVLEPEQEKFAEKMPCKPGFTGHQLI